MLCSKTLLRRKNRAASGHAQRERKSRPLWAVFHKLPKPSPLPDSPPTSPANLHLKSVGTNRKGELRSKLGKQWKDRLMQHCKHRNKHMQIPHMVCQTYLIHRPDDSNKSFKKTLRKWIPSPNFWQPTFILFNGIPVELQGLSGKLHF